MHKYLSQVPQELSFGAGPNVVLGFNLIDLSNPTHLPPHRSDLDQSNQKMTPSLLENLLIGDPIGKKLVPPTYPELSDEIRKLSLTRLFLRLKLGSSWVRF